MSAYQRSEIGMPADRIRNQTSESGCISGNAVGADLCVRLLEIRNQVPVFRSRGRPVCPPIRGQKSEDGVS